MVGSRWLPSTKRRQPFFRVVASRASEKVAVRVSAVSGPKNSKQEWEDGDKIVSSALRLDRLSKPPAAGVSVFSSRTVGEVDVPREHCLILGRLLREQLVIILSEEANGVHQASRSHAHELSAPARLVMLTMSKISWYVPTSLTDAEFPGIE